MEKNELPELAVKAIFLLLSVIIIMAIGYMRIEMKRSALEKVHERPVSFWDAIWYPGQ